MRPVKIVARSLLQQVASVCNEDGQEERRQEQTMALPFLNQPPKRPTQVIAVDLGGRTTKAVHMHRHGDKFTLARYLLSDAPVYEKAISKALLTEHLKAVCQGLNAKTRNLTVALGPTEAIVRHTEMPLMPLNDMRQVLKLNPKAYLQQDFNGHVFDCHVSLSNGASRNGEKGKGPLNLPKQRTLVAGSRKDLVQEVQGAIREAGMQPESVVPSLIGPVNAFERAMPEVFAKESVALVDIGFKATSICLLQEGELVLSRVVAIGGDKLTSGLAELVGISYAEAEGIKVGIPGEVQPQLESLLVPLGRELRASIDCFEHQQDKPVSRVYISGASSRSEMIVQTLQTELMAECKLWNPLATLELELSPEQTAEIEQVAPQLAVAVGAAMAVF
jgi:type IV pilus assembly protein PilM